MYVHILFDIEKALQTLIPSLTIQFGLIIIQSSKWRHCTLFFKVRMNLAQVNIIYFILLPYAKVTFYMPVTWSTVQLQRWHKYLTHNQSNKYLAFISIVKKMCMILLCGYISNLRVGSNFYCITYIMQSCKCGIICLCSIVCMEAYTAL